MGDIPLLHYLFSKDNKEVNDQEVLVMLTPRVIRLPESVTSEGNTVPVGAIGGEERSGPFGGGARPFEIPSPEPAQPQ